MKVLHVLLSLEVGGAEMLVYNWVRSVQDDEYAVEVCCLKLRGELGDKLVDEGHAVHLLELPSGFRMSSVRRLRRLIRERGIDVVHAHTYTPFFFSAFATWGLPGVRLVYTEHGRNYPETINRKRQLIDPWLATRADHLVTISAATREAMVDYDNFPRRRIDVIWNGVELPQANGFDRGGVRRSIGVPEDAVVVGMASRIVELKNVPLALEAFRQVADKHPEAYLVICGDGDARPQMEQAIDRLDLRERVRTLGMRDDLDRLIPSFDVFLLSSRTEGISITLLQAMAHRVPAVATDVGGNPEVVADGETGHLVPTEDPQAMAMALERLVASPQERERLGQQAERRAREHFSLRAMRERYEELYR